MAASRKYDLFSGSSDGHRGPHAAASLERPRSFREAADNRMSSSLPSSSRNGSTSSQGDGVTLLQSLVSDLKGVLDQKSPRPEELKRSISSILNISQDDTSPATVKPLTSSSVEQIRCLRTNLHESSAKARDRAKAFREAALRIDKCCSNLSKKRSRNDNSSSDRSNLPIQGGGIPKMGPQSLHTTSSPDRGTKKSEERAKTGAPNRKIRSSLMEMDVRGNSIARLSSSVDKDKDIFKLASSGATPPDEKGTAMDGWEKSKMKKKRSAIKSDASGNAISPGPIDDDRGPKRTTQQTLVDPTSRLSNKHGFRSGSAIGNTGDVKLDSASQQTGVGLSHFPRNDQDNASLPSDRRDHLVDKEGAILKAANKPKPNNREDNYAASPTSVVKVNTSVRGPRSNSGSLSKAASPNMNHTPGNSDGWEHPSSTNKFNGAVGGINRKRSASARSSSPPVVNWGGQKLQKKTRVARRSILTPVVSTRDDYPASEIMDSMAANDDRLGFTRRRSNSASQHSKSESEESGVVDNKPKVRNRKCSEIEEKGGSCVQKLGNLVLPSRKNKAKY